MFFHKICQGGDFFYSACQGGDFFYSACQGGDFFYSACQGGDFFGSFVSFTFFREKKFIRKKLKKIFFSLGKKRRNYFSPAPKNLTKILQAILLFACGIPPRLSLFVDVYINFD